MLQKIILFVLLFTSVSSFAQGVKQCNEGSLNFYTNKNEVSIFGSLVKNNEISPTKNLQSLFCFDKISDQFSIEPLSQNDIDIIHLGTRSTLNVSFDIIETKASLMLCVEEFTDKLTFFFLNGEEEVIFNSTTGIPFLTFTKIIEE